MKTPLVAAALFLGGMSVLPAQVVPTTPTRFTTRGVGSSSSADSVGVATVKPKVLSRTVTHIVLGTPRQWKMVDGRSFIGKLIAFEDLVTVPKEDGTPGATPPVPPKPTIVRNGSARFLVNSKPYELPLDRLGPDERKFIEETRLAFAAKK